MRRTGISRCAGLSGFRPQKKTWFYDDNVVDYVIHLLEIRFGF